MEALISQATSGYGQLARGALEPRGLLKRSRWRHNRGLGDLPNNQRFLYRGAHDALLAGSDSLSYAARVYADAVSRRGEGSYTPGAGKRSEGRSGGYERGRYCCMKDRAGVWYDREAMREASRALGHSRIDVIAGHYLHTL